MTLGRPVHPAVMVSDSVALMVLPMTFPEMVPMNSWFGEDRPSAARSPA